jgi:hypothetical protein
VGSIKANVKQAAHKAAFSPIVETLARLGYGMRGLIYIIMGLLAISVALGKGGAPADQQGAIAAIGRQPAGMFLLWVVLIGLASYSLWGVIRALFDPLHKGHNAKGLLARGAYLVSAAVYLLLVFVTYGYITGAGSTAQSGAQTQQSLATVMSKPGGAWLIGILGLVVIAIGLYQIYQGFNASFDKQFETYHMTSKQNKWATQLGRFGTATRGLILAIIGGSLCVAAFQSSPNQPIGIDAALATLLRQPFGVWLLAIAAVGLIAFGVFSMLSAAWFRLKR